jgi:hypothetical protein
MFPSTRSERQLPRLPRGTADRQGEVLADQTSWGSIGQDFLNATERLVGESERGDGAASENGAHFGHLTVTAAVDAKPVADTVIRGAFSFAERSLTCGDAFLAHSGIPTRLEFRRSRHGQPLA